VRETKASLQAKLDECQDSRRRAPMVSRLEQRYAESESIRQDADHFAEYQGEDIRYVAFGFDNRHSIDVLVAQIGIGAGESVLNTDLDSADSFIERAAALRYSDSEYVIAMKTLAEQFRTWMHSRFDYSYNPATETPGPDRFFA
jgi:hypothetical protein